MRPLLRFLTPLLVLLPLAAQAGVVTNEDALVSGARLCTQYMPAQEARYGIPQHLMMAVAANESGRYHPGLKAVVPWPWTVNAAGKGYYFDSKQEAISAVRGFQAKGIELIDVGCMQVNLKHHAKAFGSLQEAFDPQANVAYAAKFLRSNYDATHSWMKATAYYHSQTPRFGNPYMQAVYSRWKAVLARAGLAPSEALAQAPDNVGVTVTRGGDRKPYLPETELASLSVASDAAGRHPVESARAAAIRKAAPKLKVIKVYQNPNVTSERRENGVSVVRSGAPDSASERAEVAAVSSKIIQDLAAAPAQLANATPAAGSAEVAGVAQGMEHGVTVTRGQFAPRANVSSGGDEGFVIRR